jgi:integrase
MKTPKDILHSYGFPPDVCKLMEGYMADRKAKRELKPRTVRTDAEILVVLHRILEKNGGYTTDGLTRTAGEIREHYSPNTQRTHIMALKRYAKYLKKMGYDIDLEEIGDIKTPAQQWDSKTEDDLLSEEEVRRIIDVCETDRDKAIVAMLYDGSMRPGEVRTLKWKNVVFDEFGARLSVKFKTNYERHIRLTISVPYLNRWKEQYPEQIRPEGNVFVSLLNVNGKHHPLTKIGITMLFRRLKARSGIEKLKPSIFRPTKITHDLEDGYNQTYVQMKAWGNMSSQMLRIYAKPSKEFLDREALERSGVGDDLAKIAERKKQYRTQKTEKLWKPSECPTCQNLNPPGVNFCLLCRKPLTQEAMAEVQRVETFSNEQITEILSNPEKIAQLTEVLNDLKKLGLLA